MVERAADRKADYIPSEENKADVGTKGLEKQKYLTALKMIGVKSREEFLALDAASTTNEGWKALAAASPPPLGNNNDETDSEDEADGFD